MWGGQTGHGAARILILMRNPIAINDQLTIEPRVPRWIPASVGENEKHAILPTVTPLGPQVL